MERILHPRQSLRNPESSDDTILENIEKVNPFGFPKDDDLELDAACKGLSNALQNAVKANVEKDSDEVRQALDKLRKVYDEAAKSNVVNMPYIDVEPPSAPDSPLNDPRLNRIVLARLWVKELIRDLGEDPCIDRVVVIGNPGSGEFLSLFLPLMPSQFAYRVANYNPGKSVALVAYLLFYLIAQGKRVILQSEQPDGLLGFVFDNDDVREVTIYNARKYKDGHPWWLLVSADGEISPSPALAFCNKAIVVTSPNMNVKTRLREWKKQFRATEFISPPPSCLEVVYLLYIKLFK